jgi:periplasmic protein TonB
VSCFISAQAKPAASNVVQLRDWQPAHSRAKPRAARVPVVAAFVVSVIAHAALLYLLRAPAMPPAALPPSIEVVLVQPPVPLPLASPPAQPAPPEHKRAPPKAQPRAPARAARERVQTPPLVVPREERSTFVTPAVPVAPPAPPDPAASPAPVARAEPSAPAIAPSPQAPRPAPVSPPSFNAAYLRNPLPRYPLIARRNGEQGTVTLRVLVTRDGAPGSVVLEKTSGWPSLDAAALATVKEWRFVPAQQNGQPVDAPVLVPIVFRLQDAS